MPYHFSGQVLFAGNGDRTRAKNAVQRMLNDWNSTHPVAEQFTQVKFDSITLIGEAGTEGEVAGQVYPSLDFEYTNPDEVASTQAQISVQFNIDSNAYVTMRNLSLNLD